MTSPRLRNVLTMIHESLSERGIAHALIGAMALALYGMPRYTADIDLLSEERWRKDILGLMKESGFNCFQDAEAFAQFDSESGAYGRIDFMFVHTDDGRAILDRAIMVDDDSLGTISVVEPTDYAVLKLMAIANNPARENRDIADLEVLFKVVAAGFLPRIFKPIDVARLKDFAARFGVSDHLSALLPLLDTR